MKRSPLREERDNTKIILRCAGDGVRKPLLWPRTASFQFVFLAVPSAAETSTADSAARTAREFDAAIFDLDGVITQTAAVHSLAWKRMFDEYLLSRESRYGERFREFTHDGDYLAHVDGRPRYCGVEAFLKSRGIELPLGSPADAPGTETICGLGNRKNELFNQIIATEGVRVYDSTIALILALLEQGVRVGLATSSRNSGIILAKTRTAPLFPVVVDGLVSEKRRLRGKPEPDIFLAAAHDLGVVPARAIVIEDAVSGVQAGAKGGFALVIGIAREDNAVELAANGADVVVRDLSEISIDAISRSISARRAGDCRRP